VETGSRVSANAHALNPTADAPTPSSATAASGSQPASSTAPGTPAPNGSSSAAPDHIAYTVTSNAL